MNFSPPVIGLFYANQKKDLENITAEISKIQNVLSPLEKKRHLTVTAIEDATVGELTHFFQKHQRVHIFHFAGHANQKQIVLMDGGFKEGLKGFFSQQQEMALVFLNGCNSAEQAKLFLEAGVKVVIATDASIDDEDAMNFAVNFYESLSHPTNSKSIGEAFVFAASNLASKYENLKSTSAEDFIKYRGMGRLDETADFSVKQPWRLFVKEGCELYLDWKITRETVMLERLRQGSSRYLARMKRGRFQQLLIQDLILPSFRTDNPYFDTKVILEGEDILQIEQLLQQLWEKPDHRHFILKGEGGAGKTVSLIRLWEKYLTNASIVSPIPVFIPLSEYNGVRYHDSDPLDGFILNFIARNYLTGNEEFTLEERNALLENFRRPYMQEDGVYQPSVILLLDGFNEISVEQNTLNSTLKWLHQDFPGLQIGITSRHEMGIFPFARNSMVAHLQPLALSSVYQYLEEHGVSTIDLPNQDQEDLLQNPMMLTLYAATSELFGKFKDDHRRFQFLPTMLTKGEILWNFLEAQRARLYRDDEVGNSHQDIEVYRLLVWYLLPAIGYKMAMEGQYFFHWEQLETVLDQAINHLKTLSFAKQYSLKQKNFRLLKNRLQLSDNPDNRIAMDIIVDFLTKKLRLIIIEFQGKEDLDAHEEEGTQYVFLHQNFRDFFAARYVLNQSNIALANGTLPEVLQTNYLPLYVRKFLGELTGEHHLKPLWDERTNSWDAGKNRSDSGPLRQLLDACRARAKEEVGEIVRNILMVIHDAVGTFFGTSLDSLDLSGIKLDERELFRLDSLKKNLFIENALIDGVQFFSLFHKYGRIADVIYIDDDQFLQTVSSDDCVKIWNLTDGSCVQTIKLPGLGTPKSFSTDGKMLSSVKDETIKVWNIHSGACIHTLVGHDKSINHTTFSPDLTKLASASKDEKVKIWSLETGECLHTLKGHRDWVISVAFSPDGKSIVPGGYWGPDSKIWDVETGECLYALEGAGSGNYSVFSPDGKYVAIDYYKGFKVYDVQTGQQNGGVQEHAATVQYIGFSSDGSQMISGAEDGTVKLWDFQSRECLMSIMAHDHAVRSAKFSTDRKNIVTSGEGDENVRIWDVKTAECILSLSSYKNRLIAADISPNRMIACAIAFDHTIKVWDIASGLCLRVINTGVRFGNGDEVWFSKDGRILIATAKRSNTIQIWDVKFGILIHTLDDYQGPFNFSFVDGLVAYVTTKGILKIWNVTEECLACGIKPKDVVKKIEFGSKGRNILLKCENNVVEVWNLDNWKEGAVFSKEINKFKSVALSPDASTIAAAYEDDVLHLWNTSTSERVDSIDILKSRRYSYNVDKMVYSQDGKLVIFLTEEKYLRIWDLENMDYVVEVKASEFEVELNENKLLYCYNGRAITLWDIAERKNISSIQDHHGFLYLTTGIIPSIRGGVLHVFDFETSKLLNSLENFNGVQVQGCDFSQLNEDSTFTDEEMDILRRNGAIFNENDRQRWISVVDAFYESF